MCATIEIGYCDFCGKQTQVDRKYYYYDVDCECCVGPRHFEIVKYCKDCSPQPPCKIFVILKPINENDTKTVDFKSEH